jgi:G:T-mismatch repair DNA endonuclease (very short patch repair protein)
MSHLSDAHKIRRIDGGFQTYLDRFFRRLTCACGCGEMVRLHRREFAFSRFAPGCAGLNRSRSPGCIDFYLHKGMSVDEAIETFRLRQAVVAKSYSTEELRDRLSELNSGSNNPASISSIMKRTGKTRHQVRAELSAKSSGQNNGFYGKTHSDAVLISNANQRSRGSKYVTKPELAIWGMLHALGCPFKHEEPVGRYTVDFLVGNVILEVFGDYWHNHQMKMQFMQKNEKDAIKVSRLRELGYRVEIIWESEIFKNPAKVVERLKGLFCEDQIDHTN